MVRSSRRRLDFEQHGFDSRIAPQQMLAARTRVWISPEDAPSFGDDVPGRILKPSSQPEDMRDAVSA
jgi:hypothetical protein